VLFGRLLGLRRAGARRRADELLARFDLAGVAGRR
jgi:oleandomycin transport system ATP-binding protein